jgi:GNAT superfamily N-acetyltransferase
LFEVTFVGDNRVIAQMQLEGKRVATAVVHPEMLGKGVGKFMYESALQKLGKLESSDYLSVGSTASWAALCKKYRGVLVVNGKELAINGFYKKNNYTYPILYRTDGSKVKFDLALDSDSRKEAKAAENAFYRIRK